MMKMKIIMGSKDLLLRFSLSLCRNVSCLAKTFLFLVTCLYHRILLKVHPLWIQICYFTSLSFLGFCVLKLIKPRSSSNNNIDLLDLLFTSVSASTVSSMSTVEMEVLSQPQLIVMTILMLLGGEVFISMLGLFFIRLKLKTQQANKLASSTISIIDPFDEIIGSETTTKIMKEESSVSMVGYLGFIVLGYQIVVQVIGVIMVYVYVLTVSSAKNVLKRKGLGMFTFSVFTVVSTFASCGFIPTNENMIVFAKNSGLLLMLIPQVLLGNALYPCCLRFFIWVWGKFEKNKEGIIKSEYYLEKNKDSKEDQDQDQNKDKDEEEDMIGYKHLVTRERSRLLLVTVVGFIVAQLLVFCWLDWNGVALEGMKWYEKLVGIFFQSVNSRHTGESIVDISLLSPAILVQFVVMMYLPPYTSFLPVKKEGKNGGGNSDQRTKNRRGVLAENIIMSQLSYLTIFIIMICITESKQLKQDPLNFNVLNIVIEVISAYGNVGFSMGYSCERRIKVDGFCEDKSTGFVGRWSPKGKIILILVMFFGRLKKFNMDGGQAWILL